MGTTHTAATASYTDVNTAMGLCSDGDTLAIPAGTPTWSSTLTVAKAITVQGNGSSSTVITPSGSTLLIDVSPGSNKTIRITGIGFSGGSSVQLQLSGSNNGAYTMDQVRVDHCSFTNGKDNIIAYGKCRGLIDHNTFLNGNRDIFVWGGSSGGDYSWADTIAAGTADALFIEDNVFTQTNAGGGGLNENVYHFSGARTVIRHNDFDCTAYTSYDACLIDVHGCQPYWTGAGTADRGEPIVEIYDNTFRYDHSYRVMYLRSGSLLVHDNAFTFSGSSVEIELTQEQDWQSAVWSPLRTVWPAQDGHANCFFWNNTRNGSTITDVTLYSGADSTFIQQDRDYFMHAPANSGGKSSYTGARKGGATTAPTASDTGDTSFSAAGANAYYPYTAYTYPHPLQVSSGSTMLIMVRK